MQFSHMFQPPNYPDLFWQELVCLPDHSCNNILSDAALDAH